MQALLAWVLNVADQASWAELVRKGALFYQKIMKYTFLRVVKLGFWESAIKIPDLVGTPT